MLHLEGLSLYQFFLSPCLNITSIVKRNNPITTAGLIIHIRNKTPYLTRVLDLFKGVSLITLLRKIQKINPKIYMMINVYPNQIGGVDVSILCMK